MELLKKLSSIASYCWEKLPKGPRSMDDDVLIARAREITLAMWDGHALKFGGRSHSLLSYSDLEKDVVRCVARGPHDRIGANSAILGCAEARAQLMCPGTSLEHLYKDAQCLRSRVTDEYSRAVRNFLGRLPGSIDEAMGALAVAEHSLAHELNGHSVDYRAAAVLAVAFYKVENILEGNWAVKLEYLM